MNILKFRYAGTSGLMDITYAEGNGDIKRIASNDLPLEAARAAMRNVLAECSLFGVNPQAFRSLSLSYPDLEEVSIRIEAEQDTILGDSCLIRMPKIEYSTDEHGNPRKLPEHLSKIVAAVIVLEQRLEEYVRGERAQREIPFPEHKNDPAESSAAR